MSARPNVAAAAGTAAAAGGRQPLATTFAAALAGEEGDLHSLEGATAVSRRDRAMVLLAVYDLHTAPLVQLGGRVRFQHHPVVVDIKRRLEQSWIDELDAAGCPGGEPVAALRRLATQDRLPEIYRWVAAHASWPQLVTFLALEGGPDAGFDDLVALCQLGLHGRVKLELATNYWDELGRGELEAIHTTLHDRMVAAVAMPRLGRHEQPVEALERSALGGLLSTNRWLQPEMLGALGLIELQAGPRCRMVVRAFDRLQAPQDAYPFYSVHADVDPVHGRTWLENAISPALAEQPDWGPRILRGASWRSKVNAAFFDTMWFDVCFGSKLARRGVWPEVALSGP